MKSLNKRLVRMINESKLQYFAIAVVIIVGLLTYITFNMAILNFENSVNNYYEETNFGDIYVELVKIPEGNISDISTINGVKNVEGRVVADVPLKTDVVDEKVTVRLTSIPEEHAINTLYLIEGTNRLNSDRDALVIEQFFGARNFAIGDMLQPQISGRIYDLSVAGNVGSSEYIYLMQDEQQLLPDYESFGIVYVTEAFAQNTLGMGSSYNQVLVDVKEGYKLEKVKNEIEKALDQYGIKRIYTKDDVISNRVVTEEISGGKQMASTVPLIFLSVAAAILAVMINRLVKNDRMTIGVLKSMGYKNSQVITHYSKLSILIGFVGSLFGVILGAAISRSFTNLYLMYYKVHYVVIDYYPFYLIGAIVLGIGFSVAAGLLGARKVLKIAPAESMRQEAPKKGQRVLIENTKLWKKLSFSTKMVWRNLMRGKRRVLFIAFGIAVTLLVTVIPLFMFEQFTAMFYEQFGEFQTMDYDVKFERPVSEDATNMLYDEIEIDAMEGRLEYPFELKYQWKTKVTSVIGIKKDTQFFNFTTTDGKPIVMNKGDVYVSEGLADLLGVKKGDIININNYIPGKDDIKVKINHVIKQGLGANLYMDLETMQNALVEPGSINGVYLNSDDQIKTKLETSRNISSIRSLDEMRQGFEEFMEITIASISSLLFFAFILGFAIIYNSTIMTINDRRLEFSSLRILGMSKNEIFFNIVKEKFIIAIVGIIIGIPISNASAQALADSFSTEFYTLRSEITPQVFVFASVAIFLFVFIAILATYWKINRLNFIEALKERIT